jgi:glycosyltransferase involved in cell wall biosynthesis
VTSLQRTALGLPASEAVVLAIRGLRDLQNPLAVVRAFAEVRRTHPDVILALKLGPSDAGLTAAVAAEIESLDLGASVSVIGQMPHEKLAELYRAADVCLSVPSSDGTSVALLEAMASGRPMVVSDLPANREWITDGVNGSVVPPNDPAALADAIKRLLDSSELRSTFGHAARARVESAASSHEQMHEVELLYRSLVSNES